MKDINRFTVKGDGERRWGWSRTLVVYSNDCDLVRLCQQENGLLPAKTKFEVHILEIQKCLF